MSCDVFFDGAKCFLPKFGVKLAAGLPLSVLFEEVVLDQPVGFDPLKACQPLQMLGYRAFSCARRPIDRDTLQ